MSVASQGTADLRVTSVAVLPGSDPNQRIVRGVVENLGASTARSPEDGASIRVVPYADFYDPFQGLNWDDTTGTTSSSGWACRWDGCVGTEPVGPGASASFEFVVNGPFGDRRDLLGLHVYPATYPVSVTPDPRPANNRLLVPVPF